MERRENVAGTRKKPVVILPRHTPPSREILAGRKKPPRARQSVGDWGGSSAPVRILPYWMHIAPVRILPYRMYIAPERQEPPIPICRHIYIFTILGVLFFRPVHARTIR